MSRRMNHAHLAARQNEWVKEIGENARHAAREAGATPHEIVAIDSDLEALRYFVDYMTRFEFDNDGKQMPPPSINRFMVNEGLDWPAFSAWLKIDAKRQAALEQAKKERGYIERESLKDGWWNTALMVPVDPVTHADVHRSRDSIAKSVGAFTPVDGGQVTGSVTITFNADDANV